MNKDLGRLLLEHSMSGMIKLSELDILSAQTGIPAPGLEVLAVNRGIIPFRYLRNLGSISAAEQQNLFHAKVAVIGCGGLGGYVLEQLARLGVGAIIGWDYDIFEEHNLNRQMLSTVDRIGQKKAEAAAARVEAVNPAVTFQGIEEKFDCENGKRYLTGCQVVVDALDNIPVRLELAGTCREMQIPLVHGAVEGWYGQLATQFPGDKVIEQIYAHGETGNPEKKYISTLAFTPALVASLQVAEVIKILLERGELLRNKIMLINLLDMDMETIEVSREDSTGCSTAEVIQNK